MSKEISKNNLVCTSYIYFSFEAEYFDTSEITKRLGINPTSIRIKKEPIPKLTSWKYQINADNDLDLIIHLELLINTFKPYIEKINELKEKLHLETRIQFVIKIDVNPEASTPYFGLNKNIIDFIAKTQTEVNYDLYKTD